MKTPQETIQRPRTIYGVSKVSCELLSDYYFYRYGVDTRSVRFPGLISYETLPGGGTTDYAVEIYYAAVKGEKFEIPVKAGTFMDMMYMPDALKAMVMLMEADPSRLKHRNSFNIASMSFDPEIIYNEIKKFYPDFVAEYRIDPVRATNSRFVARYARRSCRPCRMGLETRLRPRIDVGRHDRIT